MPEMLANSIVQFLHEFAGFCVCFFKRRPPQGNRSRTRTAVVGEARCRLLATDNRDRIPGALLGQPLHGSTAFTNTLRNTVDCLGNIIATDGMLGIIQEKREISLNRWDAFSPSCRAAPSFKD